MSELNHENNQIGCIYYSVGSLAGHVNLELLAGRCWTDWTSSSLTVPGMLCDCALKFVLWHIGCCCVVVMFRKGTVIHITAA